MSQYQTGTVNVTQNNASVVGVGTAFVANVAIGNIFTVQSSNVWYEVAAVTDDTHVSLTAPYAGTTASAQPYAISNSFTPNAGIPYIEQRDVETASIFKRAMLTIENLICTRLQKTLSGSGTVTLTAAEARNRTLSLTGTISGNVSVVVPNKEREYVVFNGTSGAFSITVKTAAGSGIVVAQGKRAILQCDATNVVRVTPDT